MIENLAMSVPSASKSGAGSAGPGIVAASTNPRFESVDRVLPGRLLLSARLKEESVQPIHERVRRFGSSSCQCRGMRSERVHEVGLELFATTTRALARMGGWLAQCQVTLVAMETTGVH